MVHVLRVAADARRDVIQNAINQASPLELALDFPLGVHCALTDEDFVALFAACAALGKDVVVIGGDGALRARAVAAGFAAATSLDEWETDRHRAMLPTAERGGDMRPESGYLYVLVPETDDAEPGLYEPGGEDPPAYVAELLPPDETPTTERYAAIPTIPRMRTPAEARRDEAQREAAQTAALERAQQRYEERITGAIRASGTESQGTSEDGEHDTPPPADDTSGEGATEAEGN